MPKYVWQNNAATIKAWLSGKYESGKNRNHSFYFENDVIYSYGYHFPIARLITNESGKRAALCTIRRYSVTTACHISAVKSWLDLYNIEIFDTPFPLAENQHNVIIEYYKQSAQEMKDKAQRARNPRKQSYYLQEARASEYKLMRYIDYISKSTVVKDYFERFYQNGNGDGEGIGIGEALAMLEENNQNKEGG